MMFRKAYLRLIGDYPCARFVEAVTEYLEGAMPAPERTRFERHLRRCAGCREYLDQLRQTIATAGRITIDDVNALPAQARDELMQAFQAFHAEH